MLLTFTCIENYIYFQQLFFYFLCQGHMMECLNKLDAGSHEKILLTSRDGKVSKRSFYYLSLILFMSSSCFSPCFIFFFLHL